jgi:lipooligosaccharide transport system permease protein
MRESLSLALLVARRNWIVYKRDFLANISPTVADPIFFVMSLGLGLGPPIPGVGGRSYLRFLAPGLAMATAMFTAFFECTYGFYVRMTYENVYKAMLTTRMGVGEIIAGELIWVAAKGAFMSLGVALVLACFGAAADLRLLPPIALAGAVVAVGMGALSLLASALVRNLNQFQPVYAFLIAPLFYFSGIFFPIERTPRPAQAVVFCLPLANAVKIAQALFWDQDVAGVLLWRGGALLAISAILVAVAWRPVARRLSQP